MPPWNSAKAKVQLRLSVQRLRILQQKKEAQAKSSRRDIATLLERGRIETARIKVENIINEDIHVELLELLELYCELLLVRFGLLDQNTREPDTGISEGVSSVIYAAHRTELKELHILREILMQKYGRDYSAAVMENRGNCVSDRVARKLDQATPSQELVNAYLTEIARAYSVNWAPPGSGNQDDALEGGVGEAVDEKARESGAAADATLEKPEVASGLKSPKLPEIPPSEDATKGRQDKDLRDNLGGNINAAKAAKPTTPSARPKTPEDDFDALAKRFEALKKR